MAKIDQYMRSNLKFKHLKLLVILDETRSVGKAASYLNVTQPAISKALADFEDGLNIKLFERTTRTIIPTKAGLSLLKRAKKILNEISSARDELIAISEGRDTSIAIGILPSVSLYLFPKFVSKVSNDNIIATISAREECADTLLGLLRSGELDVAIGNLSHKTLSGEFRTKALYHDPIVVVAKTSHPLLNNQQLDWRDLTNFPMVLAPLFASSRSMIQKFLSSKDIPISKRYLESLSTNTNIGVLKETEAVGFLSKQVAEYFREQGVIKILPLEMTNIYLDIGLIWFSGRKLTDSQVEIISILEETAYETLV